MNDDNDELSCISAGSLFYIRAAFAVKELWKNIYINLGFINVLSIKLFDIAWKRFYFHIKSIKTVKRAIKFFSLPLFNKKNLDVELKHSSEGKRG